MLFFSFYSDKSSLLTLLPQTGRRMNIVVTEFFTTSRVSHIYTSNITIVSFIIYLIPPRTSAALVMFKSELFNLVIVPLLLLKQVKVLVYG